LALYILQFTVDKAV